MTLHLYVHSPTAVWKGRVNLASATYPIYNIPFDGVTLGSNPPAEALDGMTVLFGSTEGADNLGRSYIRKTSVFADTLFIGRSSKGTKDGEVTATDNAYITVVNEHRVWPRFPYHDIFSNPLLPVIYKNADQTFDVSYTTNFFPVANTGPGYAGTIDSVTGLITVTFNGTTSYGLPVAASIASYLWNVGDGTITVGTSSSSTITATFPAGFRYVSLKVTATNGGVHTAYCPVYARDPDNDTTVDAFQIESHRITPNGQQLAFRILSDLPRSTYPDGCLVMLWEDEASGPTDRSHMQFIGWHHNDSAAFEFVKTGTLRDTVLECLDVAGKMDTIPGMAQRVEHAAVPAYWYQMYQPTIDLYTHYLLYWHSTVLEVADVFLTGAGSEWAFMALDSDADTLYRQVNSHAQRLTPDHIFACNRRGQLSFLVDPMLITPFLRNTTIDTQATLAGNIAQVSVLHQRPPRVHWIWASAVLTGYTYGAVTTNYTITLNGDHLLGVTSLTVDPLPVALPSGITLTFGLGETATLTADAALGATSLSVAAIPTSIEDNDTATYSVTTPANIPTTACMAPGRTPGTGATFMTTGNKLAKSGGDLQTCEGLRYARLNNEYGLFQITLAGNTDLGIDPGTLERVDSGTIAIQTDPQRGLDFFAEYGQVREMNIRYTTDKTGVERKTVTLVWEREVDGPPAVEVPILELA